MQTTDPVCGMFIDTDDGNTVEQEFEGHGYHFCSQKCKEEFLNHPDKYRDKLSSERYK
ncbi:MAG: YHS domain-containing protein [Acidobacteriaceae bacterium]